MLQKDVSTLNVDDRIFQLFELNISSGSLPLSPPVSAEINAPEESDLYVYLIQNG